MARSPVTADTAAAAPAPKTVFFNIALVLTPFLTVSVLVITSEAALI